MQFFAEQILHVKNIRCTLAKCRNARSGNIHIALIQDTRQVKQQAGAVGCTDFKHAGMFGRLIVKIDLGFMVKGFERAACFLAHLRLRRVVEIHTAFQRGAHDFAQALRARRIGGSGKTRLLNMQHVNRQPIVCCRDARVQNIHACACAGPAQPGKQAGIVLANYGDFRTSPFRIGSGIDNQRLGFDLSIRAA